jgi:YD repeat-containing protein
VGGTATVVHDAAGNITSDGTNSYTYSDRGRLAAMTNAGGTVTYSYNALELRVGKTGPTALVPTGTAYYVYDEEGKLLGEYDANGVPVYETIYMGLPVGVVKQTGTAGCVFPHPLTQSSIERRFIGRLFFVAWSAFPVLHADQGLTENVDSSG